MCTKQNFKHTCTIQNKSCFLSFFSLTNNIYIHHADSLTSRFPTKKGNNFTGWKLCAHFFLFKMGKHFCLYGNGDTKASEQVKTSFLHFFLKTNRQKKKERTLHRHSLNKCKLAYTVLTSMTLIPKHKIKVCLKTTTSMRPEGADIWLQ